MSVEKIRNLRSLKIPTTLLFCISWDSLTMQQQITKNA